jgi:hypothetical protein
MATIDNDTVRILRRLDTELSGDRVAGDPAAEARLSEAQVRAELRAAGIDPDAAWQRMRARFAHLMAAPEPAEPLRDLAEGVRVLQRRGRELIALSLEGLGRLANAYAPAYLHAGRRSPLLGALAALGQPALVGVHPRGEAVELGLGWPGGRPVQAPSLAVSVRGRPWDPGLVRWSQWHPAGQGTDVIEVAGLHWPGPGTGAGRPVVRYRYETAADGTPGIEIELLPEDGDDRG